MINNKLKYNLTLRRVILLIGMIFAFSSVKSQTIFLENFSSYANTTGYNGAIGFPTPQGGYPGSVTNWTIDASGASMTAPSDWAMVNGGTFQFRDVDGPVILMTSSIDITGCSNVTLSVDLQDAGTFEANDFVNVEYSLNGGAWLPFAVNGNNVDDFGTITALQTGLAGTSVIIRITAYNNAGPEIYIIDNILVTGNCGVCGDGTCNPNESFATCPGDCPQICGNGTCEGTEK